MSNIERLNNQFKIHTGVYNYQKNMEYIIVCDLVLQEDRYMVLCNCRSIDFSHEIARSMNLRYGVGQLSEKLFLVIDKGCVVYGSIMADFVCIKPGEQKFLDQIDYIVIGNLNLENIKEEVEKDYIAI